METRRPSTWREPERGSHQLSPRFIESETWVTPLLKQVVKPRGYGINCPSDKKDAADHTPYFLDKQSATRPARTELPLYHGDGLVVDLISVGSLVMHFPFDRFNEGY